MEWCVFEPLIFLIPRDHQDKAWESVALLQDHYEYRRRQELHFAATDIQVLAYC